MRARGTAASRRSERRGHAETWAGSWMARQGARVASACQVRVSQDRAVAFRGLRSCDQEIFRRPADRNRVAFGAEVSPSVAVLELISPVSAIVAAGAPISLVSIEIRRYVTFVITLGRYKF